VIEARPGFLVFKVSGTHAAEAFRNEAGGHRWQRIPPSEKRGRVHTSTVTVAVLSEPENGTCAVSERDVEWKATRGSGAGGQHRNKTDSAIQLHHLPTGLRVRAEGERSQHQNRAAAMSILKARLAAMQRETQAGARNAGRKEQVGSGMRGDKVRTIRTQDGSVTDHRTGCRISFTNYARGDFTGL
jgi:peptide chain release factor 1